jgi:branched-subunit amino acid aminotransferase/4-amino-4-deoxychorismate lyase
MIWHDGKIVDPDDVRVGLDDRIFEHGLGLFETLRTYNGQARLLPKHLARLKASAYELGLPLDRVKLPGLDAVADLLNHCKLTDALLRITMTGGSANLKPPVLWMTAKALPTIAYEPIPVVVGPHPVLIVDRLSAYKSLNYWARRLAFQIADDAGAADCLLCGSDLHVWEGSRHNILLVPQNLPKTIVTPTLQGPVLPGIMRAEALAFAARHGYLIEERAVMLDELFEAQAVWLTNSVRGVRRVSQIDATLLNLDRQQEFTRRFQHEMPLTFGGT